MPKRAILLLLLQCLAMAASAQSSVQVQLPAGDFAVFASPGPALAPPPDPILSKGGAASVPLQPKLDHLYVWDRATGGLAVKTIDPKTPIWAVSPSNFTRIESVTVAAEHNGQPLSAGEVSLGDGDSRHSSVIDASAPATFFDVPQGKLNVTVKYRKKDGTSGDVTQVFQAAPKVGGLKLTVGVTDDVDTATAVPGAVGTAAPAGPVPVVAPPVKVQTANPLGSAVVLLIGIGAAAFIVYNLMRFMRGNPGTVGAKLQQLGVQIPQPADAGLSQATPLVPAAPSTPQPVQKIVLQDSAPDPYVPSAPAAITGQPSLMAESGVTIPLSDGETLVGRDPGLGLSLSAETTVSRKHASLQKMGNEVTVSDLGSSNGTYVNGVKLQSPVVLRQGDTVQFGSAKFRYVS